MDKGYPGGKAGRWMKAKHRLLFWITLATAFFMHHFHGPSPSASPAGISHPAAEGRNEEAFSAWICMESNHRKPLSRSIHPAGTGKNIRIVIFPLVIDDSAVGHAQLAPSVASQDQVNGDATIGNLKKPKKIPQKKGTNQELRFYPYLAESGDNLKTIAQKYYGSSLYFPVLLLHNPQIQSFEMEEGTEISIMENRQEAIRLFRKHTVIDHGRIFWIYTAGKNDTIEGIGKKFYQTRDVNNPLVNLNPECRIKPGERIRILLN